MNTHGHWRMTFDSSSLPDASDRIIYATLAVYKRHCEKNWRSTPAGQTLRQSGIHKTNMSVYASFNRHYAEPVAVAWQRLKFRGKCWHTFNVTGAVRSWQERSRRGLRHLIIQQRGYDGLTANDFLYLQGAGDPGNLPVLVIYSGKKVNLPRLSTRSRHRRSTSGELSKSKDGQVISAKGDPVITNNQHLDCARRDFEIDFAKSGWNKWIISPRKYNAFRCAGACKYPIPDGIRSSLHARLEASAVYYNELNGNFDHLEGSGPCCVPTHHSPTTILFHTMDGGVMLHVASKMVAERCGCR